MTTTFETAKVGDKVWSMRRGWGVVRDIIGSLYPVKVTFQDNKSSSFSLDGLAHVDDVYQSLFWDEVVIEAPVKPMPNLKIDTKVLVWLDGTSDKYCRHFSHFENNDIYVFDKGLSSWTGYTASAWDNWELAE